MAEQDGAIHLTAAFTGLRMGELLALRWGDVDFGGSTIRVRSSYARRSADHAKIGEGTSGADGPRRRFGAGAAGPTFGTRMIANADIRRVQDWMGHADIQTTMKYLRYAPRAEDARLVADAFELPEPHTAEPAAGS